MACFSAKQLVMISAFVALPITVLLLIFGYHLVDFVYPDLEEPVFEAALSYMYPIFTMYPFLAVSYSINALFRSMNRSSVTLRVSLMVNLLNVVGNAICIRVFDLGAFGVGLATLIAQIAGTLFQLRLIKNEKELIHIDSLLHFRPDVKLIKRILHIAVPSGIENGIFQIGKLIISSAIAFLGTAAITADAIMCNVTGIFNIPGSAINTAVITVVGQCCGAGRIDQAEYYSRKMLKLVWVSLLLSGFFTLLFSDFLISLFSLSAESGSLSKLAIFMIVIESIFVWAPSFTTPTCLRAAGDVNFSLGIAILSMWCFRVFGGILFSIVLDFGLAGIYLGVGLDWGFRALVYELRFRQGKWKSIKVV